MLKRSADRAQSCFVPDIDFDIWQNEYNYVKFKNKIKLKKIIIKKKKKKKESSNFLPIRSDFELY